jgi:hypothetical protein
VQTDIYGNIAVHFEARRSEVANFDRLLGSYFFTFFSILAQVSRRVTVRLKTSELVEE